MKITKSQLKKIIKEEFLRVEEGQGGMPAELHAMEKVVADAHQLYISLPPEAKSYLIQNFKKYIEIWEKNI